MLIQAILLLVSFLSFTTQARTKSVQPEWKRPPAFYLPASCLETFTKDDRPAAVKSLKTNSITSVPVIIDTSGYYTVDANLTLTESGAAIYVFASDVIIEFNHHKLSLEADCAYAIEVFTDRVTINNPVITTPEKYKTSGILMHAATHVTINNASIEMQAKNALPNAAFSAIDSHFIQINASTMDNYAFGFIAEDCSDISINGGSITNADFGIDTKNVITVSVSNLAVKDTEVGMCLDSTNNITVDSCTITNGIWGIETDKTNTLTIKNSTIDVDYVGIMPGPAENVTVSDCCIRNCNGIVFLGGRSAHISNVIFTDSGFALDLGGIHNVIVQKCIFSKHNMNGLWLDGVHSGIVEDCSFETTDSNTASFIELDYVQSAIIRNCTFTTQSTSFNSGIAILDSQSVLLEKLAIDIEPREILPNNGPAAIYIYSEKDADQANSTIKISDCVIGNKAYFNIISESESVAYPVANISIERCLINGGGSGVILSNTQSSSIHGCDIKNCAGNGITITNSLTANEKMLSDLNTISNCNIVNNGLDGIHIDANVGKTLIKENNLFNNAGTGIATNIASRLLNNTFYANTVNETITP